MGISFSDKGIVLRLDNVATSYVDIQGNTVTGKVMTESYLACDAPTALLSVGRTLALTAHVQIAQSGVTSLEVKGQISYDGTNWEDVQMVRGDTGATAAEHSFTASGYYALQTTSQGAAKFFRMVGKYTGGALGAGDKIIVRVEVL